MITMLIVSRDREQREFFEKSAHRQILRLCDDHCSYHVFDDEEKALDFIVGSDSLDIAIISLSSEQSLLAAQKVRQSFKQAFLILVASKTHNPEKYVLPDVLPSGVILVRSEEKYAEAGMKRLFDWYFRNNDDRSENGYCFKGRDGKIFLEYGNIFFFEARDKRIVLCTNSEEYYFYDTIENLTDKLPPYFVRCHRSFIVNANKIKTVKISENCLFLNNGFLVPVSRSYKQALKERIGLIQ